MTCLVSDGFAKAAPRNPLTSCAIMICPLYQGLLAISDVHREHDANPSLSARDAIKHLQRYKTHLTRGITCDSRSHCNIRSGHREYLLYYDRFNRVNNQ